MDVPAGWYPDPSGAPVQRYWDGVRWTEQRAPAPDVSAPMPWWLKFAFVMVLVIVLAWGWDSLLSHL